MTGVDVFTVTWAPEDHVDELSRILNGKKNIYSYFFVVWNLFDMVLV